MTYKRINPEQTSLLAVLASEVRLKRKHIRLLNDSGLFRFSSKSWPPSKSCFWALDPGQLILIEMITAVHGAEMSKVTARRWYTFLQECCLAEPGPLFSGHRISAAMANAISEVRR